MTTLFDDGDAETVIGVRILLLQTFQLDQQAFLQVGGADAGRIEVLHDFEYLGHFLFVGLHVHCEQQVVDQVGDGAAEVTVVIQVANDDFADHLFFVGQIMITQLLDELTARPYRMISSWTMTVRLLTAIPRRESSASASRRSAN